MSRWREPLFAGFVTFLIGNAIGLIAAGLLAPTDFAVATQMPDRLSLMDLWVRYGMPAVALLAGLATYLRLRRGTRAESETLGAALLASSLPFVTAVALVYLLYPGSRSARFELERRNAAQLHARESALSVTPDTLERTIAEHRDTPQLAEVAEFIDRSGLIPGTQPLPQGAIREARMLVQRGLLPKCPQCGGALRAKELWNQVEPGLLPWAVERCEGTGCVATLVTVLVGARGYHVGCRPLPGERALSLADVNALQSVLDARPRAIDAPLAGRLETWLAQQRAQCGAGHL